eukprot:jgi/Galph1/255/GphlegSOOS_G4992.1
MFLWLSWLLRRPNQTEYNFLSKRVARAGRRSEIKLQKTLTFHTEPYCQLFEYDKNTLEYILRKCQRPIEVLQIVSDLFEHHQVPEAKLSAEYLISNVWNCKRSEIKEKALVTSDDTHWCQLAAQVRRRLLREPIQYIIGHWDFYNITLKVRSPILVPRPETEELVEIVVKHWQQQTAYHHNKTTFTQKCLEIGCGSGAISLALLTAWKKQLGSHPKLLHITALDIDPLAVELTLENASNILDKQQLAHQLDVHHADISKWKFSSKQKFDMIISNPPYIPERDYHTLQPEVAKYESPVALIGGKDGMDVIRVILQRSNELLNPGGLIWLEVDPTHPKQLKKFLQEEPHLQLQNTYFDISGHERYCKLIKIQ